MNTFLTVLSNILPPIIIVVVLTLSFRKQRKTTISPKFNPAQSKFIGGITWLVCALVLFIESKVIVGVHHRLLLQLMSLAFAIGGLAFIVANRAAFSKPRPNSNR